MTIPHPGKKPDRRRRLRGGLALLRLTLIFVLLSVLCLCAGLQWRTALEAGWRLTGPAIDAPALSHMGVNVALEGATPAVRAVALSRLADHQIDWVRQRFDWGTMEPEKGRYDWSESDAMIAATVEKGLDIVVVLDGSPAWARADTDRGMHDNPLAPPANPVDFARFAAAFAGRYGEHVRDYQIWDEPNIAPHWGARHIEPVDYAQLLKAGATAIRSADPDAVIVAAALAPTQDRGHMAMDEGYFLQRMYAAGAKPYMDVVAIQPLGYGYSPRMTAQRREILNFQRAVWVRRVMQAAGDDDTPLWAVRFGWNRDVQSPWSVVTPKNRQIYLADALAIATHWPWLTGMAWAIDRPSAPPNDPLWGFALNDELRSIIGSEPSPIPLSTPNGALLRLAMLASVAMLLVWGGWRAARLLANLTPLSVWLEYYRHTPTVLHGALWALLLVSYYFATWPPLVFLLLVFGATLIIAHPQIGLWLALVLLPFHFQHKEVQLINQVILIPPTHAALLALLPALTIQIHERASGRRDWQAWLTKRPLSDWLALLWLVINIAAMWNVWHWPAYGHGFMSLSLIPVLLYTAVRLLITTTGARKQAVAALFAGGLAVGLVGLFGWFQGGGTAADGVRRLVGPHFSPNHTALYLERTFFVGLGLLLTTRTPHWRKQRRQIVVALCLAVVTTALVLTASRGAWLLGMPMGALVFLLLGWRPRAKRWLIGLILISFATIILTIILLSVTPAWTRLGNSETIIRRFAIWSAAIEMWRTHPLTGVGPGGFFWRYPAFIPPGSALDPNLRHPHNVWLELGSIWGVLGLIWFVMVLLVIGRAVQVVARRTWSDESTMWISVGLLAGLAAGFAHGQVDAFLTLADLAGWNWAALALLISPDIPHASNAGADASG